MSGLPSRASLVPLPAVLCLLMAPASFAQTGTISVLCENPRQSTDKVAFDIDYDRKTVRPAHTVSRFDDEAIVWDSAAGIARHLYVLDRRTGVLSRIWIPSNEGVNYNCSRTEQRKMF